MKVLLTGSTGLLGSHVLDQGLASGHSFKLLVRDIPRRSHLNDLLTNPQIEIIKVDFKQILENPEAFFHLFSDIDLFINSMGYASPLHSEAEIMNSVNFHIPKTLFKIARDTKVAHLVNVSSVATMSSGDADTSVNENFLGIFRPSPYAESKLQLDRWIDNEFKEPMLSIHPCYMLGKWDARPSSGSILFGLKLKKLKYFINNQKNFVAASDVARTLWKGVEKRETGHFLVGGVNASIENFITLASTKLKTSTDGITFLKRDEWSEQSKALEPAIKNQVEEFCLSNPVDDTKARTRLDHQPNENLETIIDETLQYFIEKKLLRI